MTQFIFVPLDFNNDLIQDASGELVTVPAFLQFNTDYYVTQLSDGNSGIEVLAYDSETVPTIQVQYSTAKDLGTLGCIGSAFFGGHPRNH